MFKLSVHYVHLTELFFFNIFHVSGSGKSTACIFLLQPFSLISLIIHGGQNPSQSCTLVKTINAAKT